MECRVTKEEIKSVVHWLRESGFNVTAAQHLPTGETELKIVLPA